MNYKRGIGPVALAALLSIGGVQAGCAQTQLPEAASAPAAPVAAASAAVAALPDVASQPAVLTPDEAKESAAGNVAELQRMIHGTDLDELRTTYNGTYGASLLFYGKEMTYYVALFQNKTFWRVVKTGDAGRAEAIYRDFAQRTLQLSEVEIRRIRLTAQNAFTDRMIALAQDHASRLQADLAVARQQQAVVSDQQKQARDQAAALQAQKLAAQDQLRQMQRQVHELQRQVDSGLPVH